MQVEYDRLVSTLDANNSTMRKVENFTKTQKKWFNELDDTNKLDKAISKANKFMKD